MQLDYTFERQLELEREESYTKGREEGHEEGRAEGRKVGRLEGQQILADVLTRLQNGDTEEELIAKGIDAKTVELALAVKSHTTA